MLLIHFLGAWLFGYTRGMSRLLAHKLSAGCSLESRLTVRPMLRDVLSVVLYCVLMGLTTVMVLSVLVGVSAIWRELVPMAG